MDIKTFISVVSNLPEDISVLAKGPTGIGKSHIFHQIGKEVGLPVIDRRLSQMTEGDIIGLPELVDGVTRFAPVDWLIRACKEQLRFNNVLFKLFLIENLTDTSFTHKHVFMQLSMKVVNIRLLTWTLLFFVVFGLQS